MEIFPKGTISRSKALTGPPVVTAGRGRRNQYGYPRREPGGAHPRRVMADSVKKGVKKRVFEVRVTVTVRVRVRVRVRVSESESESESSAQYLTRYV